MRIGIDMSRTAETKTGLGSYATSLVAALARIDRDNSYLIHRYVWHCFPEDFPRAFCPRQRNFRVARRLWPERWIRRWWQDPRRDKAWLEGPTSDVFFSPFHSVAAGVHGQARLHAARRRVPHAPGVLDRLEPRLLRAAVRARAAPATFSSGGGVDVRPHPHIGLATVTYLFAGEFMHRDSLGTAQLIRPGDVNWMVAGRGIVHSERTPPEARSVAGGATIHGIQTWIALPREHEEADPSFEHHPAVTLPEFHASGVTMRLIAGSAYGRQAPTSVFSPMFYLAAEHEPDATLELPDEHAERALYVVAGEVEAAGGTPRLNQLDV